MRKFNYIYDYAGIIVLILLALPMVSQAVGLGPVAIGDKLDQNRIIKATPFIESHEGIPSGTLLSFYEYNFSDDPAKNDMQNLVSVHPESKTISGIWIDMELDSCENDQITTIKNTISKKFDATFNKQGTIELDDSTTIKIQCKKTCPDRYRMRVGIYDSRKERFLPIVQGRCKSEKVDNSSDLAPIPSKADLLSKVEIKVMPIGLPLESGSDFFISSRPGWKKHPFNGKHVKWAHTCLATKVGTKVLSTASGKILRTGKENGWGNSVYIETDDGMQIGFHHLSKIITHEGYLVKPGDILGLSGKTGFATGPVLSYSIYHDGIPYNSFEFLPKIKKKKAE